jgi:hypothetical protein
VNVSPDQVRAATRTAAAVITADRLPPLRLDEPQAGHGRARRPGPAWFVPLVAAAAVIVIVAGSVAAGSWLTGSRNGQPGAIRQAGPYAGVPAYYVAVESPSLAVVRATSTGATLARITTRTPFVGVTGAADDRTFVLDAQRQVTGPTVRWPGHPVFYLLRLGASGAEESFTRLALPVLPTGTAVTGLALSPDGSRLAVEMDTGGWSRPGLLEIRVYTLATGAFSSWSTLGSTDPEAPYGFTGSGADGSESISWAADSRTLAFDWMDQAHLTGVRLLDTAAGGGDLVAVSRLAVVEFRSGSLPERPSTTLPSRDHVSGCVTNSIVSLDGSAIVCGYTTLIAGSASAYDTTTGFIRYSTRTGKAAAVLGVYQFHGQAPGDISLYWVNSTGTTLIGGVLTPGGIRVGVISGQTFRPLPGIAGLGAAAW